MSANIPRPEIAVPGTFPNVAALARASESALSGTGFGECFSLCALEPGISAIVTSLRSPASPREADLVRRLVEFGFVAGEQLRVIARGQPGNEPIAVRIGGTTFALRRIEADHVRVAIAGARSS